MNKNTFRKSLAISNTLMKDCVMLSTSMIKVPSDTKNTGKTKEAKNNKSNTSLLTTFSSVKFPTLILYNTTLINEVRNAFWC